MLGFAQDPPQNARLKKIKVVCGVLVKVSAKLPLSIAPPIMMSFPFIFMGVKITKKIKTGS